jgi:hypothetical protein
MGERARRRECGTATNNESTLRRSRRMLTTDMEVHMLIDEIRRTPAKVVTEEQRESYWENG